MEFGAAYVLSNAEQFWTELDDILRVKPLAPLVEHDSALKSYVAFAASYLDDYLVEDDALRQCVDLLLGSSLFADHSQRMVDLTSSLLCDTAHEPNSLLICSTALLHYGRAHPHVFRQLRHAHLPQASASLDPAGSRQASSSTDLKASLVHGGIIPALLEIGLRVGFALDRYVSAYHPSAHNNPHEPVPTPSLDEVQKELALENVRNTERRIGPVLAELLYEVCRVEKMESEVLARFDEQRITRLFELVELTRDLEDETFNYDLIRLIICLNEQYMIASLPPSPEVSRDPHRKHHHHHHHHHKRSSPSDPDANIVLKVMKQRLNESKTFGENLIFILNRSSNETAEGLCVSLLILKILYLLFTTPGTHEYFYTNDLCVLVDVFIRELNNLPEESEGLRHTYLRVLHPLLTKTQLRTYPYKRSEIRHVLLSHIQYAHLREVNQTTKRLVERNLHADWCIEMEAVSGSRRHFGAYTSAPTSSEESLTPAPTKGSTSTGRGSVVDVTAAISHSHSAAGSADAPDDFRTAVRTIRQHENEELARQQSEDRHAKMDHSQNVVAAAAALTQALQVPPESNVIEGLAAFKISPPEPAAVEAVLQSPTSSLQPPRPRLSQVKSRSLPSTPRVATPPTPNETFLMAPTHVPSRSLASSPTPFACDQAIQRSTTPTHRRPAPLPPTTKRNGEPVQPRGSPHAPMAASMSSSVELYVPQEAHPPPHSDPPVLTATGRRRPPSPPVARRKPPPPPSGSTPKRPRSPAHPELLYQPDLAVPLVNETAPSPVDDIVIYNPFTDRRYGTRQ